jgi:hypothetical protein
LVLLVGVVVVGVEEEEDGEDGEVEEAGVEAPLVEVVEHPQLLNPACLK